MQYICSKTGDEGMQQCVTPPYISFIMGLRMLLLLHALIPSLTAYILPSFPVLLAYKYTALIPCLAEYKYTALISYVAANILNLFLYFLALSFLCHLTFNGNVFTLFHMCIPNTVICIFHNSHVLFLHKWYKIL